MNEIHFTGLDAEEIIELIDSKFDYFILLNYAPTINGGSGVISLTTESGIELEKVRVDLMSGDVHVSLNQLKSIIHDSSLRTLYIYQFKKKPSANFILTLIPGQNRDRILMQNGLHRFYRIHWETFSIGDIDEQYLQRLAADKNLAKKLTDGPIY